MLPCNILLPFVELLLCEHVPAPYVCGYDVLPNSNIVRTYNRLDELLWLSVKQRNCAYFNFSAKIIGLVFYNNFNILVFLNDWSYMYAYMCDPSVDIGSWSILILLTGNIKLISPVYFGRVWTNRSLDNDNSLIGKLTECPSCWQMK
jgi:hypothetical protein